MTAHVDASESSKGLCEALHTSVGRLAPRIQRAETSQVCGLHQAESNRFAYIYHRSKYPTIRVYFRGDPNLPLPSVCPSVPVHLREKVEKGWDREFPYYVEIRESSEIQHLAQYLLDYAFPLSTRKLRKRESDAPSFSLPDELSADEQIREGARTTISVNRYERNSAARKICLAKWGTRCSVCEIDMGHRYGELGKGFVHVHHLRPIALRNGEYQLNPIEDLRPVCPNCHAIIHRRSPPLEISEVKSLIEKGEP